MNLRNCMNRNLIAAIFLMLGALLWATPEPAVAGEAYTLTRIKTLKGHTEDINIVAFSPDGKILASGSNDKQVILWDTKEWKEIRRMQGHGTT